MHTHTQMGQDKHYRKWEKMGTVMGTINATTTLRNVWCISQLFCDSSISSKHTLVDTDIHTNVRTYVCMYVCLCLPVHVCICVWCAYYICMYVCRHICYISQHVHAHMYTHKHTHTSLTHGAWPQFILSIKGLVHMDTTSLKIIHAIAIVIHDADPRWGTDLHK